MERQERNFPRWRCSALAMALTLLGLALIRTGLLDYPAVEVPPPTAERVTAAPSARGLETVRPRALSVEEQPPRGDHSASRPAEETPATPPFQGTGGIPESALSTRPNKSHMLSTLVLPTATPPRTEVIVYKVESGDNVWSISQRFGISMDTVIWANDRLEMDPDLLSIGQELYILPVSGVWHTVKAGETLEGIAKRYGVTPQKIVDYTPNGLKDGGSLTVGQKLIIPSGVKPFEPRLVRTEGGTVTVNARPEPGRFIWPCNGVITQYFHPGHLAIDIGNVEGTPIYAADAGTVTLTSWYDGLGNTVRIDHGNGYVTWYGHLRAFSVSNGQRVNRGQQIGEMGSTGKSTGPHVHFVIQYYGGAVNPIRYLPRQ